MHLSHYPSDTRTVNMSRCRMSLGNDRYVEVKEWKGELRVDLREWKGERNQLNLDAMEELGG